MLCHVTPRYATLRHATLHCAVLLRTTLREITLRYAVQRHATSKKKDLERAWDAVRHAARPRVHTFIATSEIHMQYKLRMSRDQVGGGGAGKVRD